MVAASNSRADQPHDRTTVVLPVTPSKRPQTGVASSFAGSLCGRRRAQPIIFETDVEVHTCGPSGPTRCADSCPPGHAPPAPSCRHRLAVPARGARSCRRFEGGPGRRCRPTSTRIASCSPPRRAWPPGPQGSQPPRRSCAARLALIRYRVRPRHPTARGSDRSRHRRWRSASSQSLTMPVWRTTRPSSSWVATPQISLLCSPIAEGQRTPGRT